MHHAAQGLLLWSKRLGRRCLWDWGYCAKAFSVIPQKTNSSLPREAVLKKLCVKPGIRLLMKFPECQFTRICKSCCSGKPMGAKNPFMTLPFPLAHTPEWANEQTVNTQKNSSSEAYSSVLVEKEYCGRKLVKEHFEELNFEMTFWCY